MSHLLRVTPVLIGLLALGCRSTPARAALAGETAGVERTLETLYAAFDFDAGGQADWQAMRALFIEGAAFVAPIADGATPRAVGSERFLADFEVWVRTSADVREGLHERILHTRVDLFGNVAHAWVAFEGVTPGTGVVHTRGLDSIQLVRDGATWKVASFSTHYASADEPLPRRFLAASE